MTTQQQCISIVGAAEGSWFNAVDRRYVASFANANSGLSFGTFQFDVATNIQGQTAFRDILARAVANKTIDQTTATRLYGGASKRNAKVHLAAVDVAVINELLGAQTAKTIINFADMQRAATVVNMIDGMISKAAQAWVARTNSAPILTPGGVANLRLFAYLLASLNRYPASEKTFQDWLEGKKVQTPGAPAGGWQLAAPPTVDQMHAFFRSLRIWDGTQGNYQYLRDRLDPTLARLGA